MYLFCRKFDKGREWSFVIQYFHFLCYESDYWDIGFHNIKSDDIDLGGDIDLQMMILALVFFKHFFVASRLVKKLVSSTNQ